MINKKNNKKFAQLGKGNFLKRIKSLFIAVPTKSKKLLSGFTLIEMTVVVAVFGLLFVTAVEIVVTLSDASLQVSGNSSITRTLRASLDTITKDVHNAQSVVPYDSSGTPPNSIAVTPRNTNLEYSFYCEDDAGNVCSPSNPGSIKVGSSDSFGVDYGWSRLTNEETLVTQFDVTDAIDESVPTRQASFKLTVKAVSKRVDEDGKKPQVTIRTAISRDIYQDYSYCELFNGYTSLGSISTNKWLGGMAVNPVTGRVYASSTSGGIYVIDGTTNGIITTVSGNQGYDMAVNPNTNKIYAASPRRVKVLDGATNTITCTTCTPIIGTVYLRGIDVNSSTNKVYVADQNTPPGPNNGYVRVVDGATNALLTSITIPVGASTYDVSVNPVTNRVYAANYGLNTVSVIDGATDTILQTINVGTNPMSLSVNTSTNKVYVANLASRTISIIDGSTNIVTDTISLGSHTPAHITVNSFSNKIYISTQDSYFLVIDGDTNSVIFEEYLSINNQLAEIAANPFNHRVYLALSANDIGVLDSVRIYSGNGCRD